MQTLPNPPLSWADLEPRYAALERETLTPDRAADWLKRWSDLENDVIQAYVQVKRATTEDTSSKAAEAAFVEYIQNVMPPVERHNQRLKTRLLALEWEAQPQHVQMLRRMRGEFELFNEANVLLGAEITTIANDYNKLSGSLRVELEGKTLNMAQALAKLVQTDRSVRETAWRGMWKARLELAPELDTLFLKLLEMRRQVARNAGFENYLEYGWKEFGRFDYTPQDARDLHESIALEVTPVLQKLFQKRKQTMNLETLRPWDPSADPLNLEPLKPFSSTTELEDVSERIFRALDPELGGKFADIRKAGNLDLEPRDNKVSGLGYCSPLPSSAEVYIHWSAVGLDADVDVITHESGHAFHFLASLGPEHLRWNMLAPLEFAETISQGMELLTLPLLEKPTGFYDAPDTARAKRDKLEGVLRQLCSNALIDAFQHWIYTQAPEHVTAEQLDTAWLEFSKNYASGIDWSGFEREEAKTWHQVGHLFSTPLYILEYAIAWLGALQLWRNALENPVKALEQYKYSLSLGNTKPLPELFEAAGIRFAFDRQTVRELMDFVRVQLELDS